MNQGAAQRRAERLRSQSTEIFQRSCGETFCFMLLLFLFIPLCIHLFVCCRSEEDSEGNRDICSEILQMKALERLTSTVSRHSENFFSYFKKNKQIRSFFCLDSCFFAFVFRNRYKVSWQLLWPGRLAKLVSVLLLTTTKKQPTKKAEKNTSLKKTKILKNTFYFLCPQYQSRTLTLPIAASRSLARPVRRAVR